ncbi:MAG TPA: hypothetical protein PK491_13510, partial [Candidatus Hydrogenedentes bacterium]|nr:hypothetical protein [Candidatus Hydrogenedentota bacterium]
GNFSEWRQRQLEKSSAAETKTDKNEDERKKKNLNEREQKKAQERKQRRDQRALQKIEEEIAVYECTIEAFHQRF